MMSARGLRLLFVIYYATSGCGSTDNPLEVNPDGGCDITETSSTDTDSPAPDGDASSDVGSDSLLAIGTCPDPNPTACNIPTDCAPPVQVLKSTASLPVASGGVIADGTYFMVQNIIYNSTQTGPAGYTATSTRRINSGTMALTGYQDAKRVGGFAGTYTIVGTTITVTQTCPDHQSFAIDYTSNGKQLTIFESVAGGESYAYMLQ